MKQDELIKGNHYYNVTYADSDLTVPVIRSLVYIGDSSDVDDESDKVHWYFQTYDSILKAGKYLDIDESQSELVKLHRVQEKRLSLIFNLRGLSEDIGECLDRIGSGKS